jgi:hypothetical protein
LHIVLENMCTDEVMMNVPSSKQGQTTSAAKAKFVDASGLPMAPQPPLQRNDFKALHNTGIYAMRQPCPIISHISQSSSRAPD